MGQEDIININGVEYAPYQPGQVVKTPGKFEFLLAPRFWAMVIGILSIYLEKKGLLGQDEMTMLASLTALFIGVRTFDRSVELLVEDKK